jgi:magnesium chelatase subunit D
MSNPITTFTLTQTILKGLACATLNPGLQNILVFDASYEALNAMASALTQLLQAATGKEVERVSLGVSELDDDLWGGLTIYTDRERGDQSVRWQHGLLTSPEDSPYLRLILIHDLTKLSLAAARACVMLVGADVAYVERHGQHSQWHPRLCWLASCASSRVGALSPHLLDRFSLRLSWQDSIPVRFTRDTDWLEQILKDALFIESVDYPLPSGLKERVQQAAQQEAIIPEDVCQYVLAHTDSHESFSFRREIALARLATTIAQLENTNTVTFEHITAAAQLVGLPELARSTGELPEQANSQALPSLQEPDDLLSERIVTEQQPQATVSPVEDILISTAPIPPPKRFLSKYSFQINHSQDNNTK